MTTVIGLWTALGFNVLGFLVIAWAILNSVIMMQVLQERVSTRKHFNEHHGQSKLAYWLARYFHDLIFYIPITYVASKMIEKYDPHMEMAPDVVFLQPLSMLPFIYVTSFMFTRQITAILSLIFYQIMAQWYIPFFLVPLRVQAKSEVRGD